MTIIERAKSILRFLPICGKNLKKIIAGVLVHSKPNLALNLSGETLNNEAVEICFCMT